MVEPSNDNRKRIDFANLPSAVEVPEQWWAEAMREHDAFVELAVQIEASKAPPPPRPRPVLTPVR